MGVQWNSDPQTDEQRAVWTLEGGVDTSTHPQFLSAKNTSDEDGVFPSTMASIRTRKNRSQLGTTVNLVPQGFGSYQNQYLLRVVTGKVQKWTGTAWTDIITGLDPVAQVFMTHFEFGGKPVTVFTNGVDTPRVWDDTTVTLLPQAPIGQYIMTDTVRVFIAKKDVLNFSARLKVDDWTKVKDSGFIEIFTTNGGDLTGLVRFQGTRLVFKKNYSGQLFGSNLSEYAVVDISNQIGCYSGNTVVEVQGAVFWLSFEQVYAFSGGIPTPVGDPIKKWLEKVNWTKAHLCFATTDGENYMLGLNDSTSDYPTVILSYSIKFKSWRVNRVNQTNSYGMILNNLWYTMDDKGNVFAEESGAGTTMTIISPAFTEGSPEMWKEYFELHIQATLYSGNLQVYCSPSSEGNDFVLMDTIASTTITTDTAHIIPLDTFPLSHWFRIKLVATGDAEIYSVERFFNLLPADH